MELADFNDRSLYAKGTSLGSKEVYDAREVSETEYDRPQISSRIHNFKISRFISYLIDNSQFPGTILRLSVLLIKIFNTEAHRWGRDEHRS